VKRLFFLIICICGVLAWSQSGISGSATVHLGDGGTLCNGAARVIDVRVDVTGLEGASGEPAGLNGSMIQLNLGSGAQVWYARTLSGQIDSSWPFQAIATDTSQVIATGSIKVVGWAAGDTPNQDYLVAKLVFSGPTSATDGTIAIEPTGSLASKWWDDGSTNGDGPAELIFQVGSDLSITVPIWSGLTLQEGCFFWLNPELNYDFSVPVNTVDIKDLVELVNCLPY